MSCSVRLEGRRPTVLGLVLVVLASATIAVITAPKAYANYHVEVCSDLVTGAPSNSSGWSIAQNGAFTGASLCNGGGYMWAGLFSDVSHPYGDYGKLIFNPPANTSIASFELWRWDHASTNEVDGSPQNEISYDGLIIDNCTQASGCANEGFTNSPAQSVVGAGNLTASQIEVLAWCGGAPGGTCLAASEPSEIRIYGGDIDLNQSTSPSASPATGPLVASGAHSGTQTVSFSATDNGSGVYSAALKIDGNVVDSVIPNNNSGRCQATRQNPDGSLVFNYVSPCPSSASGTLSYNTGDLTDGNHELQIVIADAAGNTATAFDGTITTDNAPIVVAAPSVSGTAEAGSTLTGTPGVFEARSGLGPLGAASGQWLRCSGVGTGCSAIAGATSGSYTVAAGDKGYTIEYQSSITDSHAHKATAISSPTVAVTEIPTACTGSSCQPNGGSGEPKGGNGSNGGTGSNGNGGSDGSATGTGGDGGTGGLGSGVTVVLPPSTPSPTANQGSVLLGSAAKWVISLKVSPHEVKRRTRIRLTGLVSTSPRPGTGKLVYLQARSVGSAWKGKSSHRHRVTVYGKWLTFQAFRAKSTGAFSSTYMFRLGGKHTYQFQAVAPAEGQYRNPTGTSTTITVKEA